MTQRESFDPWKSLWRVPSADEANINHVNLRALSAFQRALLVTDGTVTKLIEIVTMEPVAVVLLEQGQHVLVAEHPWLETGPQTNVSVRQVLIEGKYSRTLYVHATSCLVPSRLPRAILTREEARKLVEVPDTRTPLGLRDRAILEVFYGTGIRAGELAKLKT